MLPRALSVGCFLLVLGVFAAYASRPEPAAPSEVAQQLDAKMAEIQPEVVSIGPSVASMDIDHALLARHTGIGPGLALTVNGSSPAHWYALARYRVFDAGYRPRLVLIVTPLVLALRPDRLDARGVERLLPHVVDPDPVLAKKALGRRFPARVERLLQRRASLSRAWVDPIRGALVAWAFTDAWSPEAGLAANQEAASVVFSGDQGRTGRARLLPVVEDEPGVAPSGAVTDATILGDLLDLVRMAGARAVVVRVPMGPQLRTFDQVPLADERALLEQIAAHGGGYLDLRDSVTAADGFQDAYHLSRAGRALLAPALAKGLREIGALGAGPLERPSLPVVPTISRGGDSPSVPPITVTGPCKGEVAWSTPEFARLAELGILAEPPIRVREGEIELVSGRVRDSGCAGVVAARPAGLLFASRGAASGVQVEWDLGGAEGADDAWWLPPGGSLRVDVPAPIGEGLTVRALATRLGAGAAPVLRVDGAPEAPLVGQAAAEVTVQAPAPAGAWAAELVNPASGSWLLLRRLVVGEGSEARVIAGVPGHDRELLKSGFTCSGGTPAPDATLLDARGGVRSGLAIGPGQTCRLRVLPRRLHFAVRTLLVSAAPAEPSAASLRVRLADESGVELLRADLPVAALEQIVPITPPAWLAQPFDVELTLDPDAPPLALTTVTATDG